MKKIMLIVLLSFLTTGCSLLPKVNFGKAGVVPEIVDRSKVKDVCKGEAKFNEQGDMIYCSKGYFAYAENYNKTERTFTLKEKIISFLSNLVGWSFWIVLALIILCPGVLGFIGGRIIEGVIGISKKALNSTVRGIQKARKEGKPIDDALSAEQDTNEKKYIRKIKENLNL